jgi:phospholipid-translocating ATPase
MIGREHIFTIIGISTKRGADNSYILLISVVFTSLPVIFMGAFDQDVSADIAMKVPQLYQRGILRLEWTALKFWCLHP